MVECPVSYLDGRSTCVALEADECYSLTVNNVGKGLDAEAFKDTPDTELTYFRGNIHDGCVGRVKIMAAVRAEQIRRGNPPTTV